MMEAIAVHTQITLGELLDGMVPASALAGCADIGISCISQDNRRVQDGCLFIAAQGFNTHGLSFASDAVARGAVAVVWDGDCDRRDEMLDQVSNKVACIQCDDLRNRVGEIAARFYGDPSSSMNVIGITGTDGKTSIAHFLAHALDQHEKHCGVMGTLGNGFINDLHPTGLTTSDALQIQSSLAEIRDAGAEHVVMEVSSHGLDQGRVNAVAFDVAVFSNLAQDHLDYHQSIEAYGAAKRKLFFMPGLKAAVINLDDDFGRQLARDCSGHLCVWGYTASQDIDSLTAITPYIVQAKKVEANRHGLRIELVTPKGLATIDVALLGAFNVSNVMAVLASMLVSGVAFDDACVRLRQIRAVSGRMQFVEPEVPGLPTVIIDYAHTPQALEAACSSLREHFDSALWVVFGCGGDRDAGKRPLMAEAVARYAEHVVVTSDNPRHEDPAAIIEQVVAGFSSDDDVVIEPDRKQAIAYAITHAGDNDVVLIAGKGHESSQLIGDVHIAFNDYRVAQEIMESGA